MIPVRVLQFGTGALLRGLVDAVMEEAGCGVVAVGSTASGRDQLLAGQDGRFTLCIQGMENGQPIRRFQQIRSITTSLSASNQWEQVLASGRTPFPDIIVSNTTEVGLRYEPDSIFAQPPATFPAKLCALLFERFQHLPQHPFVILPTELLEDNGPLLRDLVLRHASDHQLGEAFESWVNRQNVFCSTLVDRIVTGLPDPATHETMTRELGYPDQLLTVTEPYLLWAIEGNSELLSRLPFAGSHEPVILCSDIRPYRERKLRLLNGTHTMMVPVGMLAGLETVGECMEDPLLGAFVQELMLREVLPGLPADIPGAAEFAGQVLDRFRNPFLRHQLRDISLQQTTKMKARNLPGMFRFARLHGEPPRLMCLGLAAMLHLTRQPERLAADEHAEKWKMLWQGEGSGDQKVNAALQDHRLWGQDLTRETALTEAVQYWYKKIEENGIRAAIQAAMA